MAAGRPCGGGGGPAAAASASAGSYRRTSQAAAVAAFRTEAVCRTEKHIYSVGVCRELMSASALEQRECKCCWKRYSEVIGSAQQVCGNIMAGVLVRMDNVGLLWMVREV